MIEVTRIGLKNHAYFAPLLFEEDELPKDNLVRIGVISDGYACGAAIFEVEQSMAQLISIYVLEKYRRMGAASALLDTFCELARKKGILSLTASLVGDEPELRGFLEKYDFEMFDSSIVYSFTLENVEESRRLLSSMQQAVQGRKEHHYQAIAYGDLQPYRQKEFEGALVKAGFGKQWFDGQYFSPELSFAFMDESRRMTAFMLCSKHEEWITIDLLYDSCNNYNALFLLFASLYAALKRQELTDVRLMFLAQNPHTQALGHKLFGDALRQAGRTTIAVRLLEEQQEKIATNQF